MGKKDLNWASRRQKEKWNVYTSSRPSRPKDMVPSRINFDDNAVRKSYEVLISLRNFFSHRDSLVHMCFGVVASDKIVTDLLQVEEKSSQIHHRE